MRLTIEEIPSKNQILFIGKKTYTIITTLKKMLRHYHFTFLHSYTLPHQLDSVYSIFILNDKKLALQIITKLHKEKQEKYIRVILLFIKDKKNAEKCAHDKTITSLHNIKIINSSDTNNEETITQILWFALSQSSELFLNLEKTFNQNQSQFKKRSYFIIRKKTIAVWSICIFLLIECFFLIPLIISSFMLYRSMQALRQSDSSRSKHYLELTRPVFLLARTSYTFLTRPLLSFLFIGLVPDTIINIEENTLYAVENGIQSIEHSKKLFSLILKTDKTKEEIQETAVRITLLQKNLKDISEKLIFVEQKLNSFIHPIPTIKEKIKKITLTVQSIRKLLTHADIVLGGKTKRKYVLFFENNMELRPGGGFIGSFGIAQFADYTLQSLEIKDVYEADGQLKIHVEPPHALSTYLHQPHWFLRDSNFSPDFQENFEKAEFFLEKELGLKDFDGGVAITTSALNTIIGVLGSIYVPDYQENINSDNFYIKTQIYAEKNFFPGSIQKKSFLSSLTRALILSLDRASFIDMASAIKQSLDEKHIVWYMKDRIFQENTDIINWQGRLIAPQCAHISQNCINDGIFPIDANVGVNKANFFISRLITLKIKIEKGGAINHTTSLQFKNDSPGEIFPGGTYKNYFQIYLPRESSIKEITKNGTRIAIYDTRKTDHFTILGFYFEIPPLKTTHIQINYQLNSLLQKGNNTYQLVIQKQIGSLNNDISLEIQIPHSISVISKNFPALAKERRLVYNTTLSTDKIFVIEFAKE
ncbi:MAG TPA: DUF4012 domain-containing protein [Patescibacteria group bacterium]|nr:DUF4012 domain-containing protein [Patescibacteria group bacterium]